MIGKVVPGWQFTIKAGPVTATDVTAQITDIGTDLQSNASTIFTMGGHDGTGPNKARVASQVEETQSIGFLYDGGSGFYKALRDALQGGTDLVIEVNSDDGKWTGKALPSSLSHEAQADAETSTCTAGFLSELDFDVLTGP